MPETQSETEFNVDLWVARCEIGRAVFIAWVWSEPGTTPVVIGNSKATLPIGVTVEAFAEIQTRCIELTLVTRAGVGVSSCANSSYTSGSRLPKTKNLLKQKFTVSPATEPAATPITGYRADRASVVTRAA